MPKLHFNYNELAPYLSEEQVIIHYQKHHQAYVNGANNILEKLEKARKEGADIDMKATLKELSFNIGGHVLHPLFWGNLGPAGKGGAGWACLSYCMQTQRPIIMQIEKHNTNVYPMFRIILVVDVFEHSYYIDYKNERAKFLEAFWSIVNWNEVSKGLNKY
ncbi:MAG: superoxide dismutase [Candidatus Aminicenantia bacterium]